jgi:hypothetical protein
MWALHYDQEGLKGLLYAFTDKSLHHVGHVLPFIVYRLLGQNAICWFFVLTFLHAVNALLLLHFIRRVFGLAYIGSRKHEIAIVLLFLFSPLHTEVVVWGSAMWYSTVFLLLFILLNGALQWMLSGNGKWPLWLHIVFILSLYTWELALVFPLVIALYYYFFFKKAISVKRYIWNIALPQVALCILYFSHNILRSGHLVSHYGEGTHLQFKMPLIATNIVEYCAKLSMVEFLVPYSIRDNIVWQESHFFLYILLGLVLAVILIGLYFARKGNAAENLPSLFFLTSLVLLLPVINIPNCYIKTIEQDRYLYAPSAFFVAAFITLLLNNKRILSYIGFGVFAVLSLYFQHRNLQSWQTVGKISEGLDSSFEWTKSKHVVILASCDNVNGAYCMRSQPYCSFAEAYTLHKGVNIMKTTSEVLQFDMHVLTDTFIAEKIDTQTFKLTFAQWGNNLWKNGAPFQKSYSDSFCSATVDEWGHSIKYTMNKNYPDVVYVFQQKDKWVQLH